MKKIILHLVVFFLLSAAPVFSQTMVYETFDLVGGMPSQFPALGWSQEMVLPTNYPAENYWIRNNTSLTNPLHGTHAGNGMMGFRSYMVGAPNLLSVPPVPVEGSLLISRPFDLSARGPVTPSTFAFYMYRDNNGNTLDNVAVYINTAPDITGPNALLLSDNVNAAPQIHRYFNNAPTVMTPNNWYQYFYTIPAGALYSVSTLYVIIVGKSESAQYTGNDIWIDSFQIETYPSNQSVISYGLAYQNTAGVNVNTTGQWVVAANLKVAGAANPLTIDSLVFNLLGSTTNYMTDISSARLYWTAGTPIFDIVVATQIGTQINNPFGGTTNLRFIPSLAFNLYNGDNFFWLVYNIPPSATPGNYVDGEFISYGANGIKYTSPNPVTLVGARKIDVSYCLPLYTAGTSWAGYTNNDYIAHVNLPGETGYPIIDNYMNSVGPNAGGCTGGPCPFSIHPPDYERFPAVPGKTTTLMVSKNYALTAQVGTWFSSNYLAAWIDYNYNGIFEVAEKIMQSPNLASNGTYTANFTVPATANLGATTLRVREVYAASNIDPCATYTWGETEDYTITIIPDCAILPGWRVWLGGFDDDWNNIMNWCGGVPTISSDAAVLEDIDGTTPGIQAPTYQPVIRLGVNATTRKFRIEGNSSLTINGKNNRSFTAADSLTISTNSEIKVIDHHQDSAKLYNGKLTLAFEAFSLRNPGFRQRTATWFLASEMYAEGLMNGDRIDTIAFEFYTRSTTVPYNGFTLSYYYTNANYFASSPPTTWPPVNGLPAAPVTVFTGNLNLSAPGPFYLPPTGGMLYLPLSTPIDFNPLGRDIVFVICYGNATNNASNDDKLYGTQSVNTPVSNRKYVVTRGIGGGASGCTFNPMPLSGPYQRQSSDIRPNFQFHFYRTYEPVLIKIGNGSGAGFWQNNGSFIAGNSQVMFNGNMEQKIFGSSNTTFNRLTVNNISGHVRLDQDIVVDSVLYLMSGRLKIDSNLVTLNWSDVSALTRAANGYLQSEVNDSLSYSRIRWKIGSDLNSRLFPFITAGGVYIPFTYVPTAGTHDLTVSTYPTILPTNTPLPLGVNSANNAWTGLNNAANMVKRYWYINNTGVNPQANITFTFAPAESAGAGAYRSQRFDPVLEKWRPYTAGQSNPTATSNLSPGLVDLNHAWALTLEPQPLPIELLSFRATPEGKQVKLEWITASEFNCSHYMIDRTKDGHEFTFIGRKESMGNRTTNSIYTMYDENPLTGLQYYRLTEVDINGEEKSYPLVPVNISKELKIITVADHSENNFSVIFNYNSNKPFSYKLIDVAGRIISSADGMPATEGMNQLDINLNLASGIYSIIIFNETDRTSYKFTR